MLLTHLLRARVLLLVISCAVALAWATATSVAAGAASVAPEAASQSEVGEVARRVDHLHEEVNETQTLEKYVLAPIAILVAILAAGGVLGVVYSVRDQRRISQLHELTVTGEASSQRRAEQSYGSFLEQSQTTLSLVNDTLKLAKDATDQAAHSMDIKAQARVDAIEESAQALMLEVFYGGDFESIIDDHERRMRLHRIASELQSLAGYLSLQDIKLPPYMTFVKAIDQFLENDTEPALQALRLAVQERVVGDLQHFNEYWLGYMLTTIGEYDEALGMFLHDERDIHEVNTETFQLRRIIFETEFFSIAKARARTDEEQLGIHDDKGPVERYQLVATLLGELKKLAVEEDDNEDKRAKLHTALEIARTRADILEWVAYHPDHLDDPLDPEAVKRIKTLGDPLAIPAEAALEMQDADTFRAWALYQARAICLQQKKRDFDVDFALAECRFKLGDGDAAKAFEKAEHAVRHELDEFRETRQKASLRECLLICHSRLLKLGGTEETRRTEARQVREVLSDARDTLKGMRNPRVTVFSQIQRRNIIQPEFADELTKIYEQDHIGANDE
jgi:tetratricopeptide (TPR) repeat protein